MPTRRVAVHAAALASRPQALDGSAAALIDPVDAAILQAADRWARSREPSRRAVRASALIPFSSDRKFMAAFHQVHGRGDGIRQRRAAQDARAKRARSDG